MSVVELDTRRPRLGGSTIAAACGIDPWTSPIRLWLDLTQGREREETEPMRLGKRLQPVIFAELRDRGIDAEEALPGDDAFEWRDDSRPWLVGHPDGFAEGAVVEAKATRMATDAVPPHHEAQLQTYFHLTGASAGLLAQLAGLHLSVFEVERNEHAIATMLGLAENFMGYVRSGEQPPPLGHPGDRAALLDLWPGAETGKQARETRETREIRDARRELAGLLAAEKVRAARIDHLRAVVTNYMGDADTLISSHDEVVATWKDVTSRRVDTTLLRKEQPEIAAVYSAEQTTRRFVLA